MARLVPAMLAGMRLPELARPHWRGLPPTCRRPSTSRSCEGAEIVYLLCESGNRLLTMQVFVGTRLPAHCTALGKCLLSQLPEDVAAAALGPSRMSDAPRRP